MLKSCLHINQYLDWIFVTFYVISEIKFKYILYKCSFVLETICKKTSFKLPSFFIVLFVIYFILLWYIIMYLLTASVDNHKMRFG